MASSPPHFADEKGLGVQEKTHDIGADGTVQDADYNTQGGTINPLHRKLQGRHMQMIAIGGAIGAGYFVGSGSALRSGGPAAIVIGFSVVGIMLLMTMQALAELAVMYPVNGAFFDYITRFVNKSWGFACGWDYAINWLCILPFEINAAALTIRYWNEDINSGVWITIFLVALVVIQLFGVRGYGEVEFILSIIKITAATGFMIYAIILNCGGVSSATTPPASGYIGGKFWSGGEYPAFRNGFQGFCTVFVTAAFSFGGTEMTGLAAAEAANPLISVPKASKQVFWRVTFFYVIGLTLLGLVVPANDPRLLNASTANTSASAFVLAFSNANVPGLPSVMNAVITISVLSVANSSSYGSSRTIQALAMRGMAPAFFKRVDKQGRPYWAVVLQLAFGLLAFVGLASKKTSNQFFAWLLAFAAVMFFFLWGSIMAAHIRFRSGWKAHGRDVDEIPYKAMFGVAGSYLGLFLVAICIMASFYAAVAPLGGADNLAEEFFQQWLAAFVILALYVGWKVYSRDWNLFIKASDMDVLTGLRGDLVELREAAAELAKTKTWKNLPLRMIRGLI